MPLKYVDLFYSHSYSGVNHNRNLTTVAIWAEVGTKYNKNRHAGRQCLILRLKSRQEREQGVSNAEVRVLPYRFCLEKQQLRSVQVPIKKQNSALLFFT